MIGEVGVAVLGVFMLFFDMGAVEMAGRVTTKRKRVRVRLRDAKSASRETQVPATHRSPPANNTAPPATFPISAG